MWIVWMKNNYSPAQPWPQLWNRDPKNFTAMDTEAANYYKTRIVKSVPVKPEHSACTFSYLLTMPDYQFKTV